jgi:hypothetical protein
MKIENLVPVSGLLLVLAVGCASDPNKQVQSAETNLTSEAQKAQTDQLSLDQKQADERAKKGEQGPPKQAELDRKQEIQQAETKASGATNVSDAKKDLVDAHANMAQERRDFDAKVQERLDKADAKEKELNVKSKKLDPKKTTAFNSNRNRFFQVRTDVATKARALKGTNNDGWSTGKSDLEKDLDAMESALDQMSKGL